VEVLEATTNLDDV